MINGLKLYEINNILNKITVQYFEMLLLMVKWYQNGSSNLTSHHQSLEYFPTTAYL